jgi:hypothetical protein
MIAGQSTAPSQYFAYSTPPSSEEELEDDVEIDDEESLVSADESDDEEIEESPLDCILNKIRNSKKIYQSSTYP